MIQGNNVICTLKFTKKSSLLKKYSFVFELEVLPVATSFFQVNAFYFQKRNILFYY